jgi:hypothetical protein
VFFIVCVAVFCSLPATIVLFVSERIDSLGMTGDFQGDYRFERKPNGIAREAVKTAGCVEPVFGCVVWSPAFRRWGAETAFRPCHYPHLPEE